MPQSQIHIPRNTISQARRPTEKSWAPTHEQTGAGVLPYSYDSEGNAWVLLGKETGSNTWCDFGGSKDQGELLIDTGARECWEESRGILGTKEQIRNSLSDSKAIGYRYGMYLLNVPGNLKNKITNQAFLSTVAKHSTQMEKTKIAWVKAEQLIQAFKDHPPATPQSTVPIKIDGKTEYLRAPFVNLLANKTLKSAHQRDRDILLNALRVQW